MERVREAESGCTEIDSHRGETERQIGGEVTKHREETLPKHIKIGIIPEACKKAPCRCENQSRTPF